MPRSRIEIYWKPAETAPDRVIAQVRVTDDSGSDYLLPYPCELSAEGWVNAASRKPLAVRVTYWKPYVETLPKTKPGGDNPIRGDKGQDFPPSRRQKRWRMNAAPSNCERRKSIARHGEHL